MVQLLGMPKMKVRGHCKELSSPKWRYFFNSRTAIAGAIIGLLLVFLFRRHDFCYDHMTSQPLFVHSFMQFQLNCMCDVIFRS